MNSNHARFQNLSENNAAMRRELAQLRQVAQELRAGIEEATAGLVNFLTDGHTPTTATAEIRRIVDVMQAAVKRAKEAGKA